MMQSKLPCSMALARGIRQGKFTMLVQSSAFKDKAGQRLWVQEPWQFGRDGQFDQLAAKDLPARKDMVVRLSESESTPASIRHAESMPEWASNLTVEVTEVFLIRVQDVNDKYAKRLGLNCAADFKEAWKRSYENEDYIMGWNANPLITLLEFKVFK